MRILAFSDLHRNTRAARVIVDAAADADIVVGAGDFGTRGQRAVDTLTILQQCAAPVVVVHGNHDNPEEVKTFCDNWTDGHYLHGSGVTLAGVTLFGVGGEIPSRSAEPWNAAETEAGAASMLESMPTGVILVTHTPPLGSADVQKDGTHEGSTAIRDAIRSQRPVLNLCGHIHHAWGMTDDVGDTRISNLGPEPNWFEI